MALTPRITTAIDTGEADQDVVAEATAEDIMIAMSTLTEIESAARQLSPAERQHLLIFIAQMLREEGQFLPEPRAFSPVEMQTWMDEDEQDLKEFNGLP